MFAGQPDLFVAAFHEVSGALLAAVATAVSRASGEPDVQARTAVDTFVRVIVDDPRIARLLFFDATAVGGTVEQAVRASIRRFADLIAATARPYLPDVPERLVTMGALSLVDDMTAYFVDMLLTAAAAKPSARPR